MGQRVYQLKYDDEYDKDIDTWLNGLPRSKKAEHVRHALRFYIAYAQGATWPVMPGVAMPVIQVEKSTDLKQDVEKVDKKFSDVLSTEEFK